MGAISICCGNGVQEDGAGNQFSCPEWDWEFQKAPVGNIHMQPILLPILFCGF